MARWSRLKFWSRRQDEDIPIWKGETSPPQGWRAYVNSSTVLSVLFAILPGFLTSRAYTHQRELGPTSYLIALRGVAALIVIFQHFDASEMIPWMNLPILGVFSRGTAMVCIFFIISGYSLAYKPMTLIHQQDASKLLGSLAGSVFRRYLRLYIPCLIAIILMYVLVVTGLAENPWVPSEDNAWLQTLDALKDIVSFANPFHDVLGYWHPWTFRSKYLFQLWTIPVEYRGSLVVFLALAGTCMLSTRARTTILCILVPLAFLYKVVYIALFVVGIVMAERSLLRNLRGGLATRQNYAPVPTTAHSEMEAAPVPAMTQVGQGGEMGQRQMELEEMSSSSRTGSVNSQEEDVKKETDNINDEDEEESELDLDLSEDLEMADASWPTQRTRLRDHLLHALQVIAVIAALTLGMFFCSGPTDIVEETPKVFKLLWKILPPLFWNPEEVTSGNEQFWYGIGSILIVGAIDAYPMMQRPLRTAFLQYLGDLSFGLYVLHPLLLYTVDIRMMKWALEKDTAWRFIPRLLVSLVPIMILSDWFNSMDKVLVNWGYRLQKRFFTKWS